LIALGTNSRGKFACQQPNAASRFMGQASS
jgi:hypothetical protein